jgi:hypothetical protein
MLGMVMVSVSGEEGFSEIPYCIVVSAACLRHHFCVEAGTVHDVTGMGAFRRLPSVFTGIGGMPGVASLFLWESDPFVSALLPILSEPGNK